MCFDEGKNYQIPAEVSVEAIANAGYKYADANLCAYIRENMPLTKDEWEAWSVNLRGLADSLGIIFTQSHGYFSRTQPLDSGGNRLDSECDEYTRRSILSSEILDVPWMVLHPVTYPDADGHALYKKSFEYNRAFFSKWGEFASKHNVGIAVENMLNPVGGKIRYGVLSEELIELVDTINDSAIKICIDTGHAHLSKLNVSGYIRAVGDRLRATHIADNHQNIDEHFAPLNGTISWREVIQAFKDINYQNDFAFEIHHLTSCYPASIQKSLVKFSFELGNWLLHL
jgi:sugar phosphate isomerase/epimerase